MPHVRGLHHVTMLASGAPAADRLYGGTLGLNRVKRTVNPDEPTAHHLFYGDASGTPGTLVTIHPFANLPAGQIGAGEIAEATFSVAPGALQEWLPHMQAAGFEIVARMRLFDRNRFLFEGPAGERLAFQVEPRDARPPQRFSRNGRAGVRGLHGIHVRSRDGDATGALLGALGLVEFGTDDAVTRYAVQRDPNGASFVDVTATPDGPAATMGAGSVHHAAFAVQGHNELETVRDAVIAAGFEATELQDRTYFVSFYLRGPDGLLFEVATEAPGLAVDEDPAALGTRLVLPPDLEGDRARIELDLEPLDV